MRTLTYFEEQMTFGLVFTILIILLDFLFGMLFDLLWQLPLGWAIVLLNFLINKK